MEFLNSFRALPYMVFLHLNRRTSNFDVRGFQLSGSGRAHWAFAGSGVMHDEALWQTPYVADTRSVRNLWAVTLRFGISNKTAKPSTNTSETRVKHFQVAHVSPLIAP